MTSPILKSKCVKLYGQDSGVRLYNLMRTVARIDFCVATAWSGRQVSVALSCFCTGTVFGVSDDYRSITAPDGTVIDIARASYSDIKKYLPKHSKLELGVTNKHCGLDDRLEANDVD